MNCEDFKHELETSIESRVVPDFSEAREHLKHCEHCRALSEEYHIIERAVEEWIAVDEAPDLSGRVLASLSNDRKLQRSSQPASPPSRMIPLLVGLSLVALLFLGFFLAGMSQNGSSEITQNPELPDGQGLVTPPLVGPPSADDPIPETMPENEMERVMLDTRAAYESLVHQVTEPFEPLKEVVPASVPDVENTDRPGEEVPEKSFSSVPRQLAGLQSGFRKSLGFLTAAFPPQSPAP